ncbi:MAG TPA: pentapeptide repeat-containing protein [Candidatus Elarobacter sp.]|nr:pentapeptide repeat-containing protein [Candidatus Elarobacter sp.]
MIRTLAIVAAVLLVGLPAGPVRANDDDLTRKLIDSCIGCRLPKDLHGRDLHGLKFVGADLRDADLTHTNLSDAEFTGSNLEGARFDDADLRNAGFIGARLRHTSFLRANIAGAHFVGIKVSPEDVTSAVGRAIIHDCTGCSLQGLDLHDADLRGMKAVGANLSEIKLSGARLNDANLVGARVIDADLSRTDLRGAELVATKLRGTKLTGATIGDAVLCADNRRHEDWSRPICADLRGVDLQGLDLRAARFCSNDEASSNRTCRTVTRAELIDLAHADLTGALAPA